MARFICVLLLAATLSACGQSGKLYLPDGKKPLQQPDANILR